MLDQWLPPAVASTWGSAVGVLAYGGEALGVHGQILVSFPSEGIVGWWGSGSLWRDHSLCPSGKVKENGLFCFQLLAAS